MISKSGIREKGISFKEPGCQLPNCELLPLYRLPSPEPGGEGKERRGRGDGRGEGEREEGGAPAQFSTKAPQNHAWQSLTEGWLEECGKGQRNAFASGDRKNVQLGKGWWLRL